MVDFRKILLALIAGALMLTSVASAASYGCTGTSVTPLVRWEGRAEMVGDVVLFCSGDVTGAQRITVNIRMKLNTNVTSNVVGNIGGDLNYHSGTANPTGLPITDSLLILDDGANMQVGYSNATDLVPSYNGTQNVFQAVRITDTEIEWQNVTLYAGAGTNAISQIRLTNVRGNASAFGATNGQIRAYVNITTPSTVALTNNDVPVADVRQGVYMTATSITFKRCEQERHHSAEFSLLFHEGGLVSGVLANSFKWQGPDTANSSLGVSYYNESGFKPTLGAGVLHTESATNTLPAIGQANQGTQLRAVITGIPLGVTLTFPSTAGTDPNYGLVATLKGTGNDRTPDSTGKITVIYEITASPAASVGNPEIVEIPVEVSFDPTDSDVRLIGTAVAAGGFSPIAGGSVMSGPDAEPRFMDTLDTPTTVFAIGPCRTILLFPYLTNSPGFDTGLAISNTSADPLGTQPQGGTCALNFYGLAGGNVLTAAQATQVTPSIPAGGQVLMLLSSNVGSVVNPAAPTTVATCAAGNCVLPAFQGYMFATCNFQFAHGFAFVSDLGASKLAMGYLALIVPDRGEDGRLPQNAAITDGDGHGHEGANQGEQLGL